jgi:hypothetical protein
MSVRISWSGDYKKDAYSMLEAIGTFERMGMIHEEVANRFFYDMLDEFTAYYNSKKFDGDLADLVEQVDEKKAKKIAETLRDAIDDWLSNR